MNGWTISFITSISDWIASIVSFLSPRSPDSSSVLWHFKANRFFFPPLPLSYPLIPGRYVSTNHTSPNWPSPNTDILSNLSIVATCFDRHSEIALRCCNTLLLDSHADEDADAFLDATDVAYFSPSFVAVWRSFDARIMFASEVCMIPRNVSWSTFKSLVGPSWSFETTMSVFSGALNNIFISPNVLPAFALPTTSPFLLTKSTFPSWTRKKSLPSSPRLTNVCPTLAVTGLNAFTIRSTSFLVPSFIKSLNTNVFVAVSRIKVFWLSFLANTGGW